MPIRVLILAVLLIPDYPLADEVRLGMTTALTGPSYHLGTGMAEGMLAYIESSNRHKASKHRITLTIMDDGYEAAKARTNALWLIDAGVIALVGNVGTPTAKEVLPLVLERKRILYGALTGASFLRNGQKYVANFRASYAEEMQLIVDHLFKTEISPDLTFFLLQGVDSTTADPYGEEGWQAARAAIKKKGFSQTVPHKAYYIHNTLDVRNALHTLLTTKPRPRAVVIVGTVKPSARFIVRANKLIPGLKFYNLSFVGASALADELRLEGFTGEVYATRVVPIPDKDLYNEIRDALERIGMSGRVTDIHIEGFLAAKRVVESIQRIEGDVDAEALWRVLSQTSVAAPVLLTKLNKQFRWIEKNAQ